MTKLYVTEFPGYGLCEQGDTVDVVPEPASSTTVVDSAATTGNIGTLGAITAGTLYTNGQYNNVPLTGGTGSGATANITVAGGGVTVVVLVNRGTGYTAADALSAAAANIGGTGSGFSIPVSTIIHQMQLRADTYVVELEADGICSFLFGSDPVATTSNARLPANNQPIRRRVQGQTGVSAANSNVPNTQAGTTPFTPLKISVITNT